MSNTRQDINLAKSKIGRGRGGAHSDRPVMLSEYEELWYNYYGDIFPDPTGHIGEFLTNDGTILSWTTIVNVPSIDITYLALKALKTAGTLKKGAIYKITDRFNYQSGGIAGIPNLSFLGDDRGLVYIKALEVNKLSKQAIRIMLCPVTYGDILNSQTSINIWNNTWKTIGLNQVAIWGGKVFKNLTGNIGTAINDTKLDLTNWVLQSKQATPLNYSDKEFICLYDFDNDWFEEQRDEKGNRFGLTFANNVATFNFSFNPVDITDWNMETNAPDTFFRNNNNIGVWNNSNNDNTMSLIIGSIYNNTNNGFISNNDGFATAIHHNSNNGNIYKNTNTGAGFVVCNILYNTNNGNINENNVVGSITKNSNSGVISSNQIQFGIEDCTVDEPIAGIVATTGGLYKNLLFNNFPTNVYKSYSVDISSSTDLFMIGTSLNDNSDSVLLLSSTNATETINTITSIPQNKKSKIFVAAGLVVTFVHGTGANQPRCEGGISAILNGDNGDWIEFEERGGVIYQTNIGTY